MSVRTAVVLAAGEGTRLRPLTRNRPKPMLPAANRPILEHVLDALVDADIERLVLVVGYRRDRVQDYFGPSYCGVPIEYVVQEKQLGSGHALLQAAETVSEPMVVVNGDRLIEASSIQAVIDDFDEHAAPATMAVIEHANTSRYGVVSLDGSTVTEIIEKPQTDDYRLINAGIYVFDEQIFDSIAETSRRSGELALTDTLSALSATADIRGVHVEGRWVDATYPWDLLEVATEVLTSEPAETATRDGVWVAEDARVHEAATLRPPVVIGNGCEIGPGSVVGPNVALAANTTVGSNATIERTVVDADCRIGHAAVLLDAVLGQDVHVGVGTTIPGGPADVRVGSEIHVSQQLGAVLADRVRVGGNASVEPGTLVGTAAEIGGGCHIRGRIPDDAEVVR